VAFDEGVSISRPYQHPPRRHNLPLGLGGGGGRIRSAVEKQGRGCNYHEVDDDDDDDGKGGSKGKSINDSISEHKCIVTSNIIYSITVIIPINNNCVVALFLLLDYKYLQSYGIPSTSVPVLSPIITSNKLTIMPLLELYNAFRVQS
jgi:hypothetical protein